MIAAARRAVDLSRVAFGPDGPACYGHIDAPNIASVAPDSVSRNILRFGSPAGAGLQPVVETGAAMPKTLTPGPTSRAPKKPAHTHRFSVESDEAEVTVQIGADAAGQVPGGFAKFFNRVIDGGAWGRLSNAGRAVYLPLVRFADARSGFRVRIGQAALIRHSGLSRSSVKRGVKDLLDSKLLVIAREGRVTADGRNESNVYQLLVPVDPRELDEMDESDVEPRAQRALLASDAEPSTSAKNARTARKTPKKPASHPGPAVDLPPVQRRTPSPSAAEPAPGSPPAPPPAHARPAPSVHRRAEPQAGGGPLYRKSPSDPAPKDHSSTDGRANVDDAAAVLEGVGIDPPAARRLAGQHSAGRIADAVATMAYRRSLGRCENPAGYVVQALAKGWAVPAAVANAKSRAAADAARAELAARERESAKRRDAALAAESARVDAALDGLDDAAVSRLAAAVLDRYADNAAVRQVLLRKPPRESRLMRAEIACLLEKEGSTNGHE